MVEAAGHHQRLGRIDERLACLSLLALSQSFRIIHVVQFCTLCTFWQIWPRLPRYASPNPARIAAATASTARAASGPVAVTVTSRPPAAPSFISSSTLGALTRLICTHAANPATTRASPAAGRACRPRGLQSTIVALHPVAAAGIVSP